MRKVSATLLALVLCVACARSPRATEDDAREEDYSFEAVAARMTEEDAQGKAKLREQHKEEVERCEGRGGEWMSPGVCCQWTAYGCVKEKP